MLNVTSPQASRTQRPARVAGLSFGLAESMYLLQSGVMKWIIVTGTWRLTDKRVEADVREAARKIFDLGHGLVTGGATGVDFFAMEEFVRLNPSCTKIRVFLPAKLSHYISDYRTHLKFYPINDEVITKLEQLLIIIQDRNPSALFEARKESGHITQKDQEYRQEEEIDFSDEVYAFQVNGSAGTADTIRKAKAEGLPITIHKKYTVKEDLI